MQPNVFNPVLQLETLLKHEVEFVVVGGLSAVLQGVPINTNDLGIVYANTPENVQKLLRALQELDAIYRDLAGRRIVPTESHLTAGGHNLFRTNAGPLDVLGYVGQTDAPRRYQDLLLGTVRLAISDRHTVIDTPFSPSTSRR